ncbi:hypothetical protein T484DRAFT_1933169 [Baffinella frigidus]|nr:hypothetical protein T484DRAFT_1933169 [Cryptophyta sp. CCMP2293]
MADQAKKEADEAFKEGKNEEAVKLYTTAIEQNAANGTSPKHVLLSNRSAAYAKLKKWDKALEDAQSCIECNAGFPKAFSRKGAALKGKGDYTRAAEAYRSDPARRRDESASFPPQGTSGARPAAASRPSASSAAAGFRPPPPTPQTAGPKWLQGMLLVLQIAAVGHAIGFVASSATYQGKFLFGRTALLAAFAFFIEMMYRHRPSTKAVFNVYKAMRGTATQSEVKGIADVAMDETTHRLFYTTLLFSASPGILMLVPIMPLMLANAATNVKRLSASLPCNLPLPSTAIAAQSELVVFVSMVLALFTPHRNFLTLILLGQLLRVRFLVAPDSQTAWSNLAARADALFLNPRSPGVVQSAYTRVKTMLVNFGTPTPPA